MLSPARPVPQARQSELPNALEPHFGNLKTRLLEIHNIELDVRLYLLITRWMGEFEKAQTDEQRRIDRAQYLKTIDERRALWAVKLRVKDGEKFIPLICHRILKAPMDTLPMNAFERYGRHLHYSTKIGHEAYLKTQVSIHKNYDLGPVPFNFSTYVSMCEMCRAGKTEPLKYRVQEATVHRLRLQFGNAAFPRTFYVMWHSDLKLIVGTLGRGIAESLTST